ncbi:MAG: hypothetical protein JXB85_07900 [Anaerolineales bacterium]|nr:hypothetical protein [Anaerolineales bacterium]
MLSNIIANREEQGPHADQGNQIADRLPAPDLVGRRQVISIIIAEPSARQLVENALLASSLDGVERVRNFPDRIETRDGGALHPGFDRGLLAWLCRA